MKALSWIFAACYLLICIYISLVVGQPFLFWSLIGLGGSALLVVVAFIICCLSVVTSLAVRLFRVLEFRKELEAVQRENDAA